MEIIIGLIVGIVLSVIIAYFFKNRLAKQSEQSSEVILQSVEMKIRALMPEVLKSANDDLVRLANEKLSSEKKEIRTDLENKRSEIERMVKHIQEELKANQSKLETVDKERVGTFNALKVHLEQNKILTEQLRTTTEGLKKVLSNNQLRGQFGEQVAENLLKMAGFVRGVHYEFNKQQEFAETRPDFSVFLPDKTVINVDAKFPYSNLQKLAEAEAPEQREEYRKKFEQDVKNKIKKVTTSDYIDPENSTVDFVIMFIPNEMIFSYIYDQMNEVWQEAMEKKVVMAGPFSFTAILRMVLQAHENFRYQSNVKEIIKHIQTFEKEFLKFNDEFVKIGDRIRSLDKQFNEVNITRTNKLMKSVDKIRLSDAGEPEELFLPRVDGEN